MRDAFEVWYATNAFDYAKNPIGSRECGLQWAAWQAAQSQPAPPVPADVQEILRLVQPYIAACLQFNYTPVERIEEAEADVNAAFKPLEAALTALVDENQQLKFELAGVNAMRKPLTDKQIVTGFVEWSFCRFPNGVPSVFDRSDCETAFKAGIITASHGIEPERGV